MTHPFRKTTSAANLEFFRLGQTEARVCHTVSLQRTDECFYRLRHVAAQCLKSMHSKQRENERETKANKRPFPTVHT